MSWVVTSTNLLHLSFVHSKVFFTGENVMWVFSKQHGEWAVHEQTGYKKIRTPIPFIIFLKTNTKSRHFYMSNNDSSANIINSDTSKQTLWKRQQNVRLHDRLGRASDGNVELRIFAIGPIFPKFWQKTSLVFVLSLVSYRTYLHRQDGEHGQYI